MALQPGEIRLHLHNEMASLARCQDAVDTFLRAHRLDDASRGQVMVILDELASNIIRYAWPVEVPHGFDLALSLRPDGAGLVAVLTLVDDGVPFDPTVPRTIDTRSSLEALEVGGIGLVIVARTSDRFEYRRQDGRNCVLVAKRVAAVP